MSVSDALLVLPSRMSSVAEIESFVNEVIQRFRLNDDLRGNLLISLTEAVTNAIRHGNCLSDDKTVRVEVWRKPHKLKVIVTDEGKGFEPIHVPDPTCPELLLTEGGRGVFLMRALADEICFHQQGRAVEMCYACSTMRTRIRKDSNMIAKEQSSVRA